MSENQPTARPTRKVGAGALGGAIALLLVVLLEQVFGLELGSEVVVALTTVISFVLSYFVPERTL